jgi:hypothetical protein
MAVLLRRTARAFEPALRGQVACTPGAPVPWQAVAVPTGTTPFQQGDAELEATASAQDPDLRHRREG